MSPLKDLPSVEETGLDIVIDPTQEFQRDIWLSIPFFGPSPRPLLRNPPPLALMPPTEPEANVCSKTGRPSQVTGPQSKMSTKATETTPSKTFQDGKSMTSGGTDRCGLPDTDPNHVSRGDFIKLLTAKIRKNELKYKNRTCELKQKHEAALAQLKEEHRTALARLEEKSEATIALVIEGDARTLSDFKQKARGVVNVAKSKYDTRIAKLKEEVIHLKGEVTVLKEEATHLKSTHKQEIEELQDAYDQRIAELEEPQEQQFTEEKPASKQLEPNEDKFELAALGAQLQAVVEEDAVLEKTLRERTTLLQNALRQLHNANAVNQGVDVGAMEEREQDDPNKEKKKKNRRRK